VRRLVLIASLIVAVAVYSTAGEPTSHEALVAQWAAALGLEDNLNATKQRTDEAVRQQLVEAVVVQLRQMGMPPEGEPDANAMMNEVVLKVANAWDSGEELGAFDEYLAERRESEDVN
jgi:hypothetical protein